MSQTTSAGQKFRSGFAGWLWFEFSMGSNLDGAGGLPGWPIHVLAIIKEPPFFSVGYLSALMTWWLPAPRDCSAFYNPASEVPLPHFYTILLVPQGSPLQ